MATIEPTPMYCDNCGAERLSSNIFWHGTAPRKVALCSKCHDKGKTAVLRATNKLMGIKGI